MSDSVAHPALDFLARFTDPPAEYGPLPIWWWSGGRVTRERLRWQMTQLVSRGVRQAVVMCLAPTGPLFGCLADDPPFQSPPWWELLAGACADAAELGFRLWLYDQIGFSGANLQGRLVAASPGFAGMVLRRTVVETAGPPAVVTGPAGDTTLAGYAVTAAGARIDLPVERGRLTWAGGPARVVLVHAGVSGFDYFSAGACAALIDTVHGEYQRRIGGWFGHAVGGFFQDELPAMPTWSADFADTFAAGQGYDPRPWLWALWEEGGADAAQFRRDFQEHRAARARHAFFDPLADWFDRHGLVCGFDQPTPAREGDPVGGIQVYGDYLGTHARYGAPGSDHWGDAKVHSSLAHVRGHGRTWIEAFHSSGWGGTLEETYDWLAPFLRRGATLYNPHAVYYSTARGWWEWAAPSTCWRQPYWPSYDVFATAVARLCSVLTVGSHVCDTVLLSPTSTAQAHLSMTGPLPPARAAAHHYHLLNGVNAWPSERPGVLERHGIDHDVLDEAALASSRVRAGALHLGDESYRNVILPAATVLRPDAAARLVEFARTGGTVICVGCAPPELAGLARVVTSAEDVSPLLRRGAVRVDADAPCLLRRHGDAYLLMLTAHDGTAGTAQPILDWPSDTWASQGFPWDWYWASLRERGYRFTPVGERRARVRVRGLDRPRVQQWDPRTGRRVELTPEHRSDGETTVDLAFGGPIALLVIAPELPDPTGTPPGPVTGAVDLTGPWQAQAESTMDNQWGDLAGPEHPAKVPIQVWRMEHRHDDSAGWMPVIATFGPFAEVHGPGEEAWRPAVWSLSRGIPDDPIHLDALGPKGYLPEEFLDWRAVPAGGWVGVRTHLTPPGEPGAVLAIGANAHREVYLDGTPLPVVGDGYLTYSPLPAGTPPHPSTVEIRLRSDMDGHVRASFAVVRDPAGYQRPEWLLGTGTPYAGRVTELSFPIRLTDLPADPTVQVASDGPCGVCVNGVEIGRQGDFQPYPGHREVRVHPYDLGPWLRPGLNDFTIRLTDTGTTPTVALVDSLPTSDGGLGLVSGTGWRTGNRDAALRRQHPRDPRFVCAWPRPHPLPGAGWLEPAADASGVVEPTVPDIAPGPPRVEWLRLAAPLGTVALTVRTGLSYVVLIGDREYRPTLPSTGPSRVTLDGPLPAGIPILLRFEAVDGRRGGALLDGPVEVETAEAEAPLTDWTALGLRALGGQVRYRSILTMPQAPSGLAVLDLGEVRGTADVLVGGVLADRLIWSPWHADVTGLLVAGDNQVEIVVRGTLAGYLDDASPTAAVAAGQTRTGLFGPVRLILHDPATDRAT